MQSHADGAAAELHVDGVAVYDLRDGADEDRRESCAVAGPASRPASSEAMQKLTGT